MTRHKLLKISAPAYVKMLSINEFENLESIKDVLKRTYYYGSMEYSFLKKKGTNWEFFYMSIDRAKKLKEKVYAAYIEISFCGISYYRYSESDMKHLIQNEPKALLGEQIYFDVYESQGQDFSYCQPFKTFIYQPFLKNNFLEQRTEFTEIDGLSFKFTDELDDKLYVDVQRMSIHKYGVKSDKIQNQIPVKLENAKLNFDNIITLTEKNDYNGNFTLKMFEDSSWMLNRNSKYYDISSIKDANIALTNYINFLNKVRPKLFLP